MECLVNLHIEALEEGGYVATSDEIQGLVAQGRTVQETLEIAKDVARRLLEAQTERQAMQPLRPVGAAFDYPLLIGS
jgi:predicted RNase H-like HicB family nuclease